MKTQSRFFFIFSFRNLTVFLVLLAISLLFSGCVDKKENDSETGIDVTTTTIEKIDEGEEKRKLSFSFSLDKKIYHSQEEMIMLVALDGLVFKDEVDIRVYGVPDSNGKFRADGTRRVTVYPGNSSHTFKFKTPSCYGCVGIEPDFYNITAELIEDGRVFDRRVVEIEIRR